MELIEISDMLYLDLPARHDKLCIIISCIGEMLGRINGLLYSEEITYNIQLAVHEACVNIIDHAYQGMVNGRIKVTLSIRERPRLILIELCDYGVDFNLESFYEYKRENANKGLGLYLLHSLMDKVEYFPCLGNNRWRLTRYLG